VSEVSGSNVPKLVVFNVTGFRNPDETAQETNFKILTKDKDNFLIDEME
jgi:hypothetical protein